MTSLETIAHGLGARKSGSQFVARCPAHDDRNPSLAIAQRGGRVLVKCFAGCEQRDVIAALRARGLWESSARREDPDNWGVIVRTYDYTDEHGELLYQVCRFEPKSFRPRRPNASGGWTWGLGNVRRVLYRLPELLGSATVFVPEGERDCETLRTRGFVATTNSGGAESWRVEFNPYFRGREVIILPDSDPPGRRRALQVARGVLPFAAKVRILQLPDAKDVTEWFERGHSEAELIAELERCYAR